ncbi:MAG: alpha/beta family hydrolase [Gemmatimonadales bacterium]
MAPVELVEQPVQFLATKSRGDVSGLLLRPARATCLYVLGHGAGAGMRHPFMTAIAESLGEVGVATFRYQFPYMEAGGRRPDFRPILLATVRAAVQAAHNLAGDLPLIAGGKSMGGRMTSLAASQEPLPMIEGLAFLGFPLHPPGSPSTDRADHLSNISVPMLFLQGTRDKLADPALMRDVVTGLGATARLVSIDGADHGFHVLKRSGRTDAGVLTQLAHDLSSWRNDQLVGE